MEYNDYPSLFQKSDTASVKQQNIYLLACKIEFGAILLAAFLGGISLIGNMKIMTLLQVATAVSLFASFLVRVSLMFYKWDKHWFDTRAIAESVKTATWRYVMAIEPFKKMDSNKKADEIFGKELNEIFEARKETHIVIASCVTQSDKQISDKMREIRAAPLKDKLKIYIEQRLRDEKNWYKRKARYNSGQEQLWAGIVMLCEVIGIVVSVCIISHHYIIINPLGLITTLTAVFCAWMQIKRHRELSQTYAVAEQELTSIESLGKYVNKVAKLEKFVVNTENAISREHTMWCAKK